jgi:transcription initiation factor TFIIH subunit 2
MDEIEDANAHAQSTGAAYTWEAQYKRSWDMLQEDAEGTLNTALLQLMQQQQRKYEQHSGNLHDI